MADTEKETTVIHTNSGGGGAGWFIVGALVVAVGIAGYFFLSGNVPGAKDIDVKIELPKSE